MHVFITSSLNNAFSASVSPSSLFHIPRAEINIPVLKGPESHEFTKEIEHLGRGLAIICIPISA